MHAVIKITQDASNKSGVNGHATNLHQSHGGNNERTSIGHMRMNEPNKDSVRSKKNMGRSVGRDDI